MKTFLQWLEQAGDATMMQSGKQGYDQALQKDDGLAYRAPIVPIKKSRMSEKIEKLFGKKDSQELQAGPDSKDMCHKCQ